MTEKKRTSRRLQHAARERMKATGEKYTTALQAVIDAPPLPSTASPADLRENLTSSPGEDHASDDAHAHD
ncbi:hypothetical protein ACH3VR_21190 [Microbacterium sp. B2969]|uniref:Uncharacterized protein n=1 Tax=Microbacterium alkaliflavum TaxID=3248839 RepID=A0ABW7QDB5_9MICO